MREHDDPAAPAPQPYPLPQPEAADGLNIATATLEPGVALIQVHRRLGVLIARHVERVLVEDDGDDIDCAGLGGDLSNDTPQPWRQGSGCAQVLLHEVRWVRVPLGWRTWLAERFPRVPLLARRLPDEFQFDRVTIAPARGSGADGLWIARLADGQVLPDPSEVPYHVLPISGRRYEELMSCPGRLLRKRTEQLFATIPGVRMTPRRIRTTRGYASAPVAGVKLRLAR